MNNDTNPNYKVFNLQKYYFEIRLWNPDGDEITLNPEAVLQLVFDDNLHFWPTKGFLIYENPFEILERKMADTSSIASESKFAHVLKTSTFYNFRNDGKDFLDITIKPIVEGDATVQIKELSDELWQFKHHFVVYDKEDLEVQNITQKLKKLYFWDVDYQKMLDRRVQWSTATSDQNPAKRQSGGKYDASIASDDERKMLTGEAIKDLLVTNGFEVDDEKFDTGSSKILYTAFHDMSIWENIEYLLSNHISKKTDGRGNTPTDTLDICVFDKDRFTNKFELEPLYKIFSKAGKDARMPLEYQLEHLFFDETLGEERPSPNKAPMLEAVSTTTDVKMVKIKKYQYVDMSGGDSTKSIVTMPVHSYDFKNKTFSINMTDSNVVNLEEKIKSVYIENKLLTKQGKPYPLLTLNKDKIDNKTFDPVYSLRSDMAVITKKGLGRMLYASLFLNNCLVFNVDGATIRKSGRFVGIDRMSFSDNKFDYKLCGQWFITNVKHIFFHNMYVNEVTAVKLHSYDNLNIDNTVA